MDILVQMLHFLPVIQIPHVEFPPAVLVLIWAQGWKRGKSTKGINFVRVFIISHFVGKKKNHCLTKIPEISFAQWPFSAPVLSASRAQLERGGHSVLERSQKPVTPAASWVMSVEIGIPSVTINLDKLWSLNTQFKCIYKYIVSFMELLSKLQIELLKFENKD